MAGIAMGAASPSAADEREALEGLVAAVSGWLEKRSDERLDILRGVNADAREVLGWPAK